MAKLSEKVRSVIWLMMTNAEFREASLQGNAAQSAKDRGIKLTAADEEALSKIDPSDLDALLKKLERDMTLIMGGSRPRPEIQLSARTISELKNALESVD
jgi:hypothetical protein